MQHRRYCYLYVTCEDRAEADRMTDTLLEKRLIACAKFLPVDCAFWWQGGIEKGREVLVMMESAEDLFDEVEAAIAKLHSYETFVLEAVPVVNISKRAQGWLKENLKRTAILEQSAR